jgi:hypothetical protein
VTAPDVDDEQAVVRATAPARWLLELAGDGIPLTQTYALARSVVREAAERWPAWWRADIHGPPHRETDLALLHTLRDGLQRLRLVRRRGRRLIVTARGRQLAREPGALLDVLATDLGAGDAFTDRVAEVVVGALRVQDDCDWRALDRAAFLAIRREPWSGAGGVAPSERDVAWAVSNVLRRGESYGLMRRDHVAAGRLGPLRVSLTPGGRLAFPRRSDSPADVVVFDARLLGVPGVGARVAVRGEHDLTTLHDAIQEAFGWWDDHLYSFWLDGRFWGDQDSEYTSPVTPDHGAHTADLPVDKLELAIGQKIAYVFDFGDEWRVQLVVKERRPHGCEMLPCVLERRGTAPPQYPDEGETVLGGMGRVGIEPTRDGL